MKRGTDGCNRVALVTACVGQATAAITVLYSEVNPANGHTYYLLSQSFWDDAEAKAVELGGYLATIRNAAENDFVWQMGTHVPQQSVPFALWIGLNDVRQEGTWAWASGDGGLSAMESRTARRPL